MNRLASRTALGFAGTALLVVAGWVGQASAHVSVDTLGTAHQGDELVKLGFGVPNESDTAGTVKVEVQMPQDTPLTFVAVQPKAGWEVSTTTRTLDTPITGESGTIDSVIDTVTWTAVGDTVIGPGQFDQFWLSAGSMPEDADALEFPTVQTYDNGDVVRWIEPESSSGEEPEHPIPTLQLVAADAAVETPADTPADTPAATDDDGVDGLTIVALVVGILGLAAGAAALASTRRRSAPTA